MQFYKESKRSSIAAIYRLWKEKWYLKIIRVKPIHPPWQIDFCPSLEDFQEQNTHILPKLAEMSIEWDFLNFIFAV